MYHRLLAFVFSSIFVYDDYQGYRDLVGPSNEWVESVRKVGLKYFDPSIYKGIVIYG